MYAYKGFEPDLSCRGYRFVMGKNVTPEANCASNGFHCAEDPLDCLTYYGLTQAPANIGSTIVPLTIAAQRESYWETYIAV